MNIKKEIQNENGYIVIVVVVLFLMVLSMMTVATYKLSRGESVSISNKVERTQELYSLMGGIEFALAAYQEGKFEDGALPFSIGGIGIVADTVAPTGSEMSTYGTNQKMVLNIAGDADSEVIVYFNVVSSSFANSGVFISGSNGVSVSGGGEDNNNVPSIPTVDTDALYALAASQSHVHTGNYNASSSPSNFYASGSIPNVIWVDGDLTVSSFKTVHGIYVVGGSVSLGWFSHVDGVIYMTSGSNVNIESLSSVDGGVVGNCSISGASSAEVDYDSGYMSLFDTYRSGESSLAISNEQRLYWQ